MRPEWLNKKVDISQYDKMRKRLKPFNVHTVCEQASCPNISECYCKNVATFLVLGDVCTRSCMFCGVRKGNPMQVDESEPTRVAAAVEDLGLSYVVITGVTRDDLVDKGASHYAQVVKAVSRVKVEKEENVKVEILIPDFDGQRNHIQTVCDASPVVIGHNIETVQALYPDLGRDEYRYEVSLSVLETLKSIDKDKKTKSGIMLGLGETEKQIMDTLIDLHEVDCDYLTIGQYLSPSKSHAPVVDYISPEKFDFYRDKALGLGFKYVKSGPYVRSSYLAEEYSE